LKGLVGLDCSIELFMQGKELFGFFETFLEVIANLLVSLLEAKLN